MTGDFVEARRLAAAAGAAALLCTEPAAAQWTAWTSRDAMSDAVETGISSARAAAAGDARIEAFAGITCGSRDLSYFGFSRPPNLSKSETRDGHDVANMRVRFDADRAFVAAFSHPWGSPQIATRHSGVREGILSKRAMLLEVPWHGRGDLVFRFDLAGANSLYREHCAAHIGRAEECRLAVDALRRRQPQRFELLESYAAARRYCEDRGLEAYRRIYEP